MVVLWGGGVAGEGEGEKEGGREREADAGLVESGQGRAPEAGAGVSECMRLCVCVGGVYVRVHDPFHLPPFCVYVSKQLSVCVRACLLCIYVCMVTHFCDL